MPRTKHTRKPKLEQQSIEECALLVRDFERQAELRILKMEAEGKMEIKSLETFIDVTLSRIPVEIRRMTLGEILALDSDAQKENYNEVSSSVDDFSLPSIPTTVKAKKTSKRITTASDDGYVTEGLSSVTRASRATKVTVEPPSTRRGRSSSRNSKAKLSEINGTTTKGSRKKAEESLKADKFKTPAVSKPSNDFGLVTPKIKPNTPMNVLRRPRQGEMVLSMQGSPLLVSAVVQENIANINVPLRDGNVISLLPKDGLRMSHFPMLDPETMQQLETLKNHIEKVISTKK